MNKKFQYLFIITIVVFSLENSYSRNGLSVDFGIGIKPDISEIGTQVGDRISDYTLEWHNAGTKQDVSGDDFAPGMDFAFHIRYDFLQFLFIRTGFNYSFLLTSPYVEWKVGAAEYRLESEFESISVPLTLGFNYSFSNRRSRNTNNIYIGFGLTYGTGELIETGTYASLDTKYSFIYTGLGFHFLVGGDINISQDFYLFIEIEYTSLGGYDSSDDKVGAGNYGRLEVIPGGFVYRFGIRYHIWDVRGF